jgi:hypothetical protein
MKKALTDSEAEDAIVLRSWGMSLTDIGILMNVSTSTAENVVKRMGAYRVRHIEGGTSEAEDRTSVC